MTEQEIKILQLKAKIEALEGFNYTIAFTGSLKSLQQTSYVLLSDICIRKNKLKAELSYILNNEH